MRVIGALQLVLDQDPTIGTDVLAKQVRSERTNGPFLSLQFKVDIERFCQHGHVLRPRKPWRKAGGLADPNVAEVNTLEASQWLIGHALVPHGKNMDKGIPRRVRLETDQEKPPGTRKGGLEREMRANAGASNLTHTHNGQLK